MAPSKEAANLPRRRLVTCARRELLCSDTVKRSSLRGSRDTPSRRGGDQRGHLARPSPSGRTDGYRSQL